MTPTAEESDSDEGDSNEAETDKDDEEPPIDSDISAVEMVIKAEQWCKQALKESEPDHTWCTRLALTYVGVGETEAAVKQYEQVGVSSPLTYTLSNPINRLQSFSKLRTPFKRTCCETFIKHWANIHQTERLHLNITSKHISRMKETWIPSTLSSQDIY